MISLTLCHITSGALAVIAGAIAMLTRKGGGVHVRAGKVFVVLMTVSSLLGAVMGLIAFEQFFITVFAGLLGAYLVVSGWLSVQKSGASTAVLDRVLTAVNTATFLALVTLGGIALNRPDGAIFGFAGENYLFLATMSGIAAAADFSRLFRKSISRKHVIARHLWRMLLGFFIAAGSAFTGPGASVFPDVVRASGILALPELIILIVMTYYLVRTVFFSATKPSLDYE